MQHNYLKNATLLASRRCNSSALYRVQADGLFNEYYISTSDGTRTLMSSPEVVGYGSYLSMVPSTMAALDFLKPGLEDGVSILTILRGGLNYPLEECCHALGIPVRNMHFVSCERIIESGVITGLDIKYEKLRVEKDCTLMIGDIIASGDTLRRCLEQVVKRYRRFGGSFRRIVFFTVGGTKAIPLMEKLASDIRAIWPEFQGFQCVFYEGIFSVYEDKGCTGVNIPDIDFYWKDGVISPEFRRHVLRDDDALFEKCIIYDGGARRYEIPEHYGEVMQYWRDLKAAAPVSDFGEFLEEKAGHRLGIGFDEWLSVCGYSDLDRNEMLSLYSLENEFLAREGRTFEDIADRRMSEFSAALGKYI